MNAEKLKQLQAQAANVRIGGKGTARRKKKVIHRTATTDDKKLQSSLKKLSVNTIPGIEEVNMIKTTEVFCTSTTRRSRPPCLPTPSLSPDTQRRSRLPGGDPAGVHDTAPVGHFILVGVLGRLLQPL